MSYNVPIKSPDLNKAVECKDARVYKDEVPAVLTFQV